MPTAASIVVTASLWVVLLFAIERYLKLTKRLIIPPATNQATREAGQVTLRLGAEHILLYVEPLALRVCGDDAQLYVTIFSAHKLKVTYAKVHISETPNQGGFVLESAEQQDIFPFQPTRKQLKRSLTPDEQKRYGTARSRVISVNGSIDFEGGIKKQFNESVIEYIG